MNSDGKPPSFTLKFITWNIAGRSTEDLEARTEAVCKIIEKEQADVALLQEIVPETADYINRRMSDYQCCFADENEKDLIHREAEKSEEKEDDKASNRDKEMGKDQDDVKDEEDKNEEGKYFVGTLLKKSSVIFNHTEIVHFPSTEPPHPHNLLKVNVTYKDLPMRLLNSHLKCLKACSRERKDQLRIVFENMLDAPENETVIFGGDTNLRENEITELGGLPPGIEDVWVTCGSQKRFAYTFDVRKNDNLKVNWKGKSGCRFDRVFVRRSSPSKLKPVSFELIGLERLSPFGCFPSDHWGILCHFERDDFIFKLDGGVSTNSDDVQLLQPFWMRKTHMKKL